MQVRAKAAPRAGARQTPADSRTRRDGVGFVCHQAGPARPRLLTRVGPHRPPGHRGLEGAWGPELKGSPPGHGERAADAKWQADPDCVPDAVAFDAKHGRPPRRWRERRLFPRGGRGGASAAGADAVSRAEAGSLARVLRGRYFYECWGHDLRPRPRARYGKIPAFARPCSRPHPHDSLGV